MSQQPYPTGTPQARYEPSGTSTPLQGDERAAAIVAHLSALIAAVLSAGSLSLLGPLIVWLLYKNKSQGVREAAAGAFNFNLGWWVLYCLGWVFFITFIGVIVAVPLWIIISIVALWCHIRGAIRAGDGREYRYPFQIRILS